MAKRWYWRFFDALCLLDHLNPSARSLTGFHYLCRSPYNVSSFIVIAVSMELRSATNQHFFQSPERWSQVLCSYQFLKCLDIIEKWIKALDSQYSYKVPFAKAVYPAVLCRQVLWKLFFVWLYSRLVRSPENCELSRREPDGANSPTSFVVLYERAFRIFHTWFDSWPIICIVLDNFSRGYHAWKVN